MKFRNQISDKTNDASGGSDQLEIGTARSHGTRDCCAQFHLTVAVDRQIDVGYLHASRDDEGGRVTPQLQFGEIALSWSLEKPPVQTRKGASIPEADTPRSIAREIDDSE